MEHYFKDLKSTKYFEHINLKALPEVIRNEFEKVYNDYVTKSIILEDDDDFNYFSIHSNIQDQLLKLLREGQLFTTPFSKSWIENSDHLKNGFSDVKFKNSNDYGCLKFKSDEYLDWYIAQYYRPGFLEGYGNDFKIGEGLFEGSEDEFLCQNVFNIVLKGDVEGIDKCEHFYDNHFDNNVLNPYMFYEFGITEGKFIKAWEIVIKYPQRFEKLFNGINLENRNREPVTWLGSPTELTELIKSLIVAGKLDNKLTEKKIVERFEKFFEFDLNGHDQTKSKIRNRAKDLTPFIDKLKLGLEQWIKEKD